MTVGTGQRIDMEDSTHSSSPMAVIKTGFMKRTIIEHMDILFIEGFYNRLGNKATG